MNKNDYFIDVSSYQSADLTAICQAAGTRKTIIKVSEGTNYLSPARFTQTQTSEPVGYYHFAHFGGNVSQAIAEANFFISNLPAKAPYLVCDYEDGASGSLQANTNAVIAFMDKCAQAGYKPIYYSGKPYTLANVDYKQIIAKYPTSLWIAAYPNYNVTPDPIWEIFPSMDGIRWWQFTSTGIAGGLDKNVVLIGDDSYETTNINTITNKEKEEVNLMQELIELYAVAELGTVFIANLAAGTIHGLTGEEYQAVKAHHKFRTGKEIYEEKVPTKAKLELYKKTYGLKEI